MNDLQRYYAELGVIKACTEAGLTKEANFLKDLLKKIMPSGPRQIALRAAPKAPVSALAKLNRPLASIADAGLISSGAAAGAYKGGKILPNLLPEQYDNEISQQIMKYLGNISGGALGYKKARKVLKK